jgi:hypothetical protein
VANKSVFSTSILAWVAVPSLVILLTAGSANTQSPSVNYNLVLASGFLCNPGDSSTCPAVAKSENGDTYEISGAGTFDPQSKSVKAAGTFNHKLSNGNLIETGVWVASDLVSFGSYGIAPAALIQKGPAFGPPQIGPKRLGMRSGPLPTGGLAIFRILLTPMSGTTKTALLQVNCALGDVPRERSVEGIRLNVERNGGEFSEEAGGRVMFLAVRPEMSMVKTPQEQKALENSPQPQN